MSSRDAIADRLDAGDHRGAWVEMMRFAGADPTAAECHALAHALARLDTGAAGLTAIRVAMLASMTAEPLAPILEARGLRSHLAVRTYVAPFDQWTQEALDPASALFAFAPDVVVVAIRLEDLCPVIARDFLGRTSETVGDAIDEAAARVGGVLQAIRGRSSAKLLVHAMVPPAVPALGMIDEWSEEGQRPAVRRLNAQLARQCKEAGDAYLIDIERLVQQAGTFRWHDARMEALARMPYTPAALHALAEEYLRYLRAFAGRARKVLVTDLDDTVWGGIVGEVGVERLQIGTDPAGAAYLDVQRELLNLHRRGVLLAIDSKNNPDDALAVFDSRREMLLRREHFAAMRINWHDKAANLAEIADELELALDSFVYIDDNPAECDRVRAACPDVLVVPLPADIAQRADAIRRLGVFDRLTHSGDDRERGARYRADAERRRSASAAQSLDEFYASLAMQLAVEPISEATIGRAADLTTRTNQFNLTTRRFTPDALRGHLADARRRGFVFSLTDRFGDHGWIGVALVERRDATVVVTDFMLSCRVLRRTVETAALAALLEWAREQGADAIEGEYVPTPRNGQVATFYADHGFAASAPPADDEPRRFRRALDAPLAPPVWIHVSRSATAVS